MNDSQIYNVTLPCVSPMIKWSPGKERGDVWNLTYTESSWSTHVNNTMGRGRPGHSSAQAASYMTYTYTGRNAWIFGTTEDWEQGGDPGFRVLCDSDGTTKGYEALGLPGNLLGGCRGMRFGDHEVVLFVNGGAKQVQIWSVTTEAEVKGGANLTLSNRTEDATSAIGTMNSFFTNTTGRWETRETLYGPEENSPSPVVTFPRVRTTLPGSSVTIVVPEQSHAIYLFGTINYDHTTFSVQVDDEAVWTGNASSSWGDYDQVLFQSPLDPAVPHSVEVTNLGKDNTSSFDLSRVVFLQARSTTPFDYSSRDGLALSPGRIAGITVGGILGLALAATLIYLLIKRKRNNAMKKEQAAWGPVDLTDEQLAELPKQGEYTDISQVQPFLMPAALGHTAPQQSSKGARPESQAAPATEAAADPAGGYDPTLLHSPLIRADADVISPVLGGAAIRSDVPVTQETDAGPLQPEVIPPRYNEKWARRRN